MEPPLLIANPIYDVVFKYLLDDEKVARLLLSALLEQDVEEVQYRATEHRLDMSSASVTVLRLDFLAKIRLADGTWKLVLIEIQKARSAWDLERFRRYLGSQYSNPDNTYEDADGQPQPLPIISIYFLGEALEHTDATLVRVGRTYRDGVTGEEIKTPERFIESLTHDSLIVQIPYLKARRRSELEQLLSVFDQARIQDHKHQLAILEEELSERYREVLRRLQRAIAEPKVREEMSIEDEVLQAFRDKDKALEAKDRIIEEKEMALEAKDKALEEERRASAAKDMVLEEERRASVAKDKALADQARLIEELKRQVGKTQDS